MKVSVIMLVYNADQIIRNSVELTQFHNEIKYMVFNVE